MSLVLRFSVEWHMEEGAEFSPIVKVATVSGPARKLLLGERVALNTLARCSGVATKYSSQSQDIANIPRSRKMLQLVRQSGYPGILAGTRKTTPGFRLVEKYGMLVGGIDAHRYDLSSMIMLKDNHIWSKGTFSTPLVRSSQDRSQKRSKQLGPLAGLL